MTARWRCRGFGVELQAGTSLTGVPRGAGTPDGPPAALELVAPGELRAAWSGEDGSVPAVRYRVAGAAYHQQRGVEGDLLATLEGEAGFHVDAAGATVRVALAPGAGRAWERVLLDAVLGAVAARRGLEGLHAAAVAGTAGAVAICAGSGAGKSTLLATLVAGGAPFVTDDLLFMAAGGGVRAHPGPPVASIPPGAPAPGPELAVLGDERWCAIDGGAPGPLGLGAIVLLDRRGGGAPALRRIAPSPPDLLAHVLHTGGDRARMRARLELVADLAVRVPVYRLESGYEAPPSALAAELAPLLADGAPDPIVPGSF